MTKLFNRDVRVWRAWAVHAYTSLGLVAGFLALRAMLLQMDAQLTFVWLGVALFIDATDGPFARRWEVTRWTPNFSGRKLDDIVDYLNYTFLSVFAAYRFGLAPSWGMPVLWAVLIASAYGFCEESAKTDDGYFTGFPSYWDVIVFYLYLLDGPGWANALILAIFAVLVFVRVKYVTWKTKILHNVTFVLSMAWCASLLALIVLFEQAPLWLVWLSLLFPAYHFGLSFYLHLTGRSSQAEIG